jgi:hypothetical protein
MAYYNKFQLKFKKLPAKYYSIMMPLILSSIMCLIISGINTYRYNGYNKMFLSLWMNSWKLSWLIAFPSVLLLLPLAKKIVSMIVETPNR